MKRVKELEQERRQYPSQDTRDPNYRRLAYVRYPMISSWVLLAPNQKRLR